MNTINRRELLQRVAYLMGGALSAPAMLGVLNGCAVTPGATAKPIVLTPQQLELVAEIAEIMIPRTDTPGAKDVGVPMFVDLMLKDAYASADRERFIAGLNEFDALALREHQQPFLALGADQQLALVQREHDAAVGSLRSRPARATASQLPFILMQKELTLLGYFMSEPGITQVQQYDPVPGAYHGCVPRDKAGNGKAWALDAPSPF